MVSNLRSVMNSSVTINTGHYLLPASTWQSDWLLTPGNMMNYTSLIYFVPRKPELYYSSRPFTGPQQVSGSSGDNESIFEPISSLISFLLLLSKVSDHSRGWPEGSLFDSYYTKV